MKDSVSAANSETWSYDQKTGLKEDPTKNKNIQTLVVIEEGKKEYKK